MKGPRPGGPPVTIGLLMGKPRMQRLVARYADEWNCYLAFGDSRVEAYRAAWAVMAACERYGRDPATLRRHVTVAVALPGHEVRYLGGMPWPSAVPLPGSRAAVAEQLAAFADAGAEHVSIFAYPMTAEGSSGSRRCSRRCADHAKGQHEETTPCEPRRQRAERDGRDTIVGRCSPQQTKGRGASERIGASRKRRANDAPERTDNGDRSGQ